MNKRTIALLLVLIFLLIIWKFMPALYFNYGKKLLDKQEFVKAYSSLKTAYMLDKSNKDYKYYYVKALVKQKPTIPVQKMVFELANSDINDSAQQLAKTKIQQWRDTVLQNYSNNYIEQTPINNGILRWDVDKFPIKIFILDKSGVNLPPYYQTEILKAFSQWQSSTGFIKFAKTDKFKNADIVIEIIPMPSDVCEGNVCQYVLGFTNPIYRDKLLKRMEITLYSKDPYGRFFSDKELYNTVLHEIGHSLGIMGHSYNSDDLMYISQDDNHNIYAKYRSAFQYISAKDVNTIKLLYKLMPDITNSTDIDTTGLLYAPIILGSSKDIALRKLKEAQNYVKNAPNMPNGYVDLASAYTDLNNLPEALKAMKKAYELSKTDGEKYMTSYNLAAVYFQNNDKENAMKYASIAKSIDDSDEVNELIVHIKLIDNK